MTREEALGKADLYVEVEGRTINYLKDYINKIYDYFESRTCENCSFENNCIFHLVVIKYKYKDFGCNKWEKRIPK